jgi:hypothetical protein
MPSLVILLTDIRTLEWGRSIVKSSAPDDSPTTLSVQQVQDGHEIVDQGCRLQQEIIAAIFTNTRSSSESQLQTNDSTVTFYHWILAGLCHMFSKPAWVSLGWNLPVMHETLRKDQILKALVYTEEYVEKCHLGSFFYVPISAIVGVELSSDEDRVRVLRLLQRIKETGFAVVSSFESDLQLTWGKV